MGLRGRKTDLVNISYHTRKKFSLKNKNTSGALKYLMDKGHIKYENFNVSLSDEAKAYALNHVLKTMDTGDRLLIEAFFAERWGHKLDYEEILEGEDTDGEIL
jgi:hypothetical protein